MKEDRNTAEQVTLNHCRDSRCQGAWDWTRLSTAMWFLPRIAMSPFLLSENVRGYLCLFVRRFIQFQKYGQSTFESQGSVKLGIQRSPLEATPLSRWEGLPGTHLARTGGPVSHLRQ